MARYFILSSPKTEEMIKMKVEVMILGVCCECQRMTPVCRNPKPEGSYLDPETGAYYTTYTEGEEDYLIMEHYALGERCEGEGTVPQALVP